MMRVSRVHTAFKHRLPLSMSTSSPLRERTDPPCTLHHQQPDSPNEFHHAYTTITTANSTPAITLPLHRALYPPLSRRASLSLVVTAFPFTKIVRVLILVLYTVFVIRIVVPGVLVLTTVTVAVRVTYFVTVAPRLSMALVLSHEFHQMISCRKPFR